MLNVASLAIAPSLARMPLNMGRLASERHTCSPEFTNPIALMMRSSTRAQVGVFLLLVLLVLLCSGPASGQRWPDERQIEPFRFHADFSLQELEPMLRETACLSEEIPAVLQLPPGRETVRRDAVWVYMFSDQANYHRYVQQYFPGAPTRRALYIKGRGPGMVFAFAGDAFEEDLRHESTHAILHTLLREVPLWLDEGLAEYFECPPHARDAGETIRDSVLRDLHAGVNVGLEALEQKTETRQMQAVDYRHARAWVHFLLHGPGPVREIFREYLRELQVHVPPRNLSQRLVRQHPDYERLFVEHQRAVR